MIIDEIMKERAHQIELGWTTEHDDTLTQGQLAAAAATYAFPGMLEKVLWPFTNPPKIKSTRENLIRAAALIVAEIERLDRQSPN